MKTIFLLSCIFIAQTLFAQNNREGDFNNINWGQVFITKSLEKKTAIQAEYQWRRTEGLRHGQQSLFRTAFQYKPNDVFSAAIGYAEVETFAYGDYPIAANGTFPEHRLFEQAILKQSINKFSISSRLRIEQRWLGVVKPGTKREIERWNYLNRFRYLLKLQYPLTKNVYAWLGDELFIGAGKNVGVNIFDQNRLHACIGYKINKALSVEVGYINQTLQQGRMVNNKTIIQRNNGIILALLANF